MSPTIDAHPVASLPLDDLRWQLLANIDALAARRPGLAGLLQRFQPVRRFHLLPHGDHQQLAIETSAGIQPIRTVVGPPEARRLASQLFPHGSVTVPPAVFGEDLGWLWTTLYAMPASRPELPGHRAPLHLLLRDLERLWLMMHMHDWRQLLADSRVLLYVGQDAFQQLRQTLCDELGVPWPQISVTLDASLIPPGATLNSAVSEAAAVLQQRFSKVQTQLRTSFPALPPGQLAARLNDRRPLRVLGITSRYTTFLQHSMRDWLAAFERLGHQTHLVIESADHMSSGPVVFAEACIDFRPDLVVVIDHFRKELVGLPESVPVVMWVQDALPNLFTPTAGAAQGPLDYCLGFARLKMIDEFTYPASRYMPAVVGLNDERFAPTPLTADEQARFGCDVAFVSHASQTAESIVEEETVRGGNSPPVRALMTGVLARLQAVYDDGRSVTEPIVIERMISQACDELQLQVTAQQFRVLADVFVQRVNNALFRHQSLLWIAETGVSLKLWGRGWEQHPTLGRFARGVANNASDLPKIYQASRINLQVTPHGAVHQRTMEGLAAGGFFLLRHCPGDEMERDFQAIYDWCQARRIDSDEQLRQAATPDIRHRLQSVAEALQRDPFSAGEPFIRSLRSSSCDGYIRSAATVWPADYDAVAFRSKQELHEKLAHYLTNETERRDRAASMRRVVLDRFTYLATTRRLLDFVAADLAGAAASRAA